MKEFLASKYVKSLSVSRPPEGTDGGRAMRHAATRNPTHTDTSRLTCARQSVAAAPCP
jgi:hypothetical protein